MDVLKNLEEKAFWGHEFLTWLWYRIEAGDGALDVPGVGPVVLWVEDRMTLGSLDTESKENILRNGEVARSAEAAAALAVGKKVLSVRLGLAREDREYGFTLSGDTFDLASVRLPKVEPDEDGQWHGTALVRYALVREVLEVVDGLFDAFVSVRLSAEWPQTVAAMSRWVATKEGG